MADSKAPFPDRLRTVGSLLRAPYRHLQDVVYAALAADGHDAVRPAHSAVFRHIRPDGSRVTELAEQAGMTKQSMAALVDHLEKHGYVRSEPDPTDGRAKRVVLTEGGEIVQREAARLSAQVEAEWAAALGGDDMATLRRLLERLVERLG